MDSTASTLPPSTRLMPFLAIFQHDLRSLWQSRLVRVWLAATVVLTLLMMASRWAMSPTSHLIASLLGPYLIFPWFFVAIVLGVTPVSSARTDALADGILSRPITRHEYLLAAWTARVVLVVAAFLLVTAPASALVAFAKRPVADDPITFYGIAASLGAVGLVLTYIVTLGFLAGTALRKPLLAVVVAVFVWVPAIFLFDTFSLEEFSPITLDRKLPNLLRQPWQEPTADPDDAESESVGVLGPQTTSFLNVFGDAEPEPEPAPRSFFHHKQEDKVSLPRIALGYGIPTLISLILAALCFHWRDI